jgi:O-succinylbenzoic acid--CoA ligase
VLGGPTLFAGYRLRPDLDAAAFDPSGRFVTGDLGRLDTAGRLQLLGRADDVIITGGENVAPTSVEAALADLPGVLACAVIGSPDREWGQVVVAVIACAPAAEPSLELHAVRAALSGRLPASWLPRRLVRVPSIPLLSTGKPDRAALAALAALAQPKER